MKSIKQMKKAQDSDLYFAVSLILLGFDKIPFAILSFLIGCLLCFIWGFAEAVERKIKNRKYENETFRN